MDDKLFQLLYNMYVHETFSQGSCEGILMRFTAPVTCLDVNVGHTHLAAGSAEFTIKVVEIADSAKTYTLHGHEAPPPLGEI